MPWDNLLESLFFGDLAPCEKRHPESKRAQEYWKDCNARMRQVREKLSEADVEVLERY